jgi:cyclic pyranopterin phosphate synthase
MIHAISLEANITRHCINHCASCSHASPFARPYFMQSDQLAKDLATLKPFFHAGVFSILGGEPLLHPQICNFLDVIIGSGIADTVEVLTNGSLLERMPEAFWPKLDRLVVSAYTGKFTASIRKLVEERARQHGFFFGVREYDAFYKQFKHQPDDGVNSFKSCPWKKRCWTVHDGHFFLCPQAAFFPDSFMGLPQITDGLSLDEKLTEETLLAFINRSDPLCTCRICDSYSELRPWHEVTTSRKEWMEDATV